MAVGAPPYPGYKGCFMIRSSQSMVVLWVLLMFWDAGKCKCVIQFPSSNCKGHQCCWYLCRFLPSEPVSNPGFDGQFCTSHTRNIRQRWRQNLPNGSGVSRRQVAAFFLMTAPLNLEIGVIYYLYIFGRSCAGNEWDNNSWCWLVLLCMNVIVIKVLPVSWRASFNLCSVVLNCSDIGLPATLPMALGTVSSAFATSKRNSHNLGWHEWSIQSSQVAYFFTFVPRQGTIAFGRMDWRSWTQFILMKVALTLEYWVFNH